MPDLITSQQGIGLYLEQQLTQFDPNLFKTVYPESWSINGNNHQTRGDLPRGLLKISATRITEIGDAGIYDGKTQDIPLVDFTSEGADFTALSFVVGARWLEDEIDSYRLAQRTGIAPTEDPIQTKVEAMKRICEMKAHNTILFGSRARNFRGWFNNGTVPITPAVGTQKPYLMTNQQLYDWFSNLLVEFAIKNGLSPLQIVAYVDPRLMRKLNQFLEGGASATISQQLVSPNTQTGLVREIRSIYELTPEVLSARLAGMPNAPSAGTGRIVFGAYQDVNSAVRRYYPFTRTQPEKLPGTFQWVVLGSYGTSELMHKQPMLFNFVDYSTALS
jgi:hypothetical protein